MRTALHLRIHGTVQGVGYRAFATRAARRLEIDGWVRNLRDGTVEALGEGEEGSLRAWVEELRRGPRGGEVTRIDEEAAQPAANRGFDVRW